MTMSAVKTTPITRMAPMGNFCRTAPKLDEATPSGMSFLSAAKSANTPSMFNVVQIDPITTTAATAN